MTMRPSRLAPVLMVAVMMCALAGCGQHPPEEGPVVLPEDVLCGVFPADQVAPMLPPGTYTYTDGLPGRLLYFPSSVSADGDCSLSDGESHGYIYIHVSGSLSDTVELLESCHGGDMDVVLPSVGRLNYSGYCVNIKDSSWGPSGQAWAEYWGGRYVFDKPDVTMINVIIRAGDRDPVESIADAARVVQMVLDFIARSYEADPSAATYPTAVPGSTPVPPSPAPTESNTAPGPSESPS